MRKIRSRFAPSPTGPLHLGGVRTALYAYLWAKQNNGDFVLRIEDTDQNRYVSGAEEYIQNSLKWCGLHPDEGPVQGGDFGPYRQSERNEIYRKYANQLLENGWAYKAYDSQDEIDEKREVEKDKGNQNWQYDLITRSEMRNTLSLEDEEIAELEENKTPFVVRLKVPKDRNVEFNDLIRGKLNFDSNLLDDKVLFKADGYPTYHMANVIDDHLMEITHVIRGEEWLSSTPIHVLLYEGFGWTDTMPEFAHLPLILKPEGKGKLSKRDGAKFGFPVFPLIWTDPDTNESSAGYRETGFLSESFVNFLAFLGWNPGTDREIFSLEELIQQFDFERVSKSGARFDWDKAKWFNQQHIIQLQNEELGKISRKYFEQKGYGLSTDQLEEVVGLFKERVQFINDLPEASYYLFEDVKEFDIQSVKKKWKPELTETFYELAHQLRGIDEWTSEGIEAKVKEFMDENNLGFGQILPVLRLAICGTMQGPSIFHVMAMLTKAKATARIEHGVELFNEIKQA